MPDALAPVWYGKFMDIVQHHESSALLKDAAIRGQLGKWTTALTGVVCSTCEAMGWKAAAKGNLSTLLPEARKNIWLWTLLRSSQQETVAGDFRSLRLNWRTAAKMIGSHIRSGKFFAPVQTFELCSAIGRMQRKATRSFATCPSRSHKRWEYRRGLGSAGKPC